MRFAFGVRPRTPSLILRPRLLFFCTANSSTDHQDTVERRLAHLLQRCALTSDLRFGSALHSLLLKRCLLSSLFLQNHLLNMYFKCSRNPFLPLHLFDQMPHRNVFTWSTAIAGLVQCGHPRRALALFHDMHRLGSSPNEFTLVSALKASSLAEDDCAQARQIYAQVIRLGFECNMFLMNAFLMAFIRSGRMDDAVQVFDKCGDKNVVSWNQMLAGYFQFSWTDMWGFWCRMNRAGVRPDEFSFCSVLSVLAKALSLRSGVQVHGQLIRYGHGEDVCVGNSLVEMYSKNKDLASSCKAFGEMPWHDVVAWTQMAAGSLDCGEPAKALSIMNQMKMAGITPNKFTLATLFNACASLTSLEEGKKTHGFRIKLGNHVDECVDNALIDMYAKCGSMSSALQVFRLMQEHSVISWTTVIMGFAQNGFAREAVDTFEEMISENVKPNCITMICVLYACGQGGLVEEGRRYFKSMVNDHGIVPEEDHYACMVDLLGKAGFIAEAEGLIKRMPFQPGLLVWQTLLGACQVHGDVETGERAAEQALSLEKKDPSTYVLLSNMFADARNWDAARRVREIMEEREVRKMPGSSWIRPCEGLLMQ